MADLSIRHFSLVTASTEKETFCVVRLQYLEDFPKVTGIAEDRKRGVWGGEEVVYISKSTGENSGIENIHYKRG